LLVTLMAGVPGTLPPSNSTDGPPLAACRIWSDGDGALSPSAVTGKDLTGLLNGGSILEELLVTWPEQRATAVGESTTSTAAESVSTALPDLLSGLF
jgi:hypothetical protein